MENSLWNWELVGDLANTAQLTGLDIPKIVGLIIGAASSPRILKQRVLKFGQHVKDIMDLLKALDLKAMMENEGTRNILHRLEEVLKKSYILVNKCKNKGYLYLFRKGLTLSQDFKQAQAEIDECLKIIPLMVLREFQLFREHYVNAREEEECKKKLAAIYIFNFKQLLDEAAGDITDKTDYEYFAKKWGHDERFKNLDHIQRISLFNERKGKTRQATHIASFKAMPGNSSSERSKGNPSNVHLLVGELLDDIVGEPLDDGVLEDFIEDLIMSAGDSLSVEQLIEECEKRNQLRLLKPILEHLVSEGSQDVHVHRALSKVIIDTNDNPEHFLTANPYYDSYGGNPSNVHLLVGELLDDSVGEPLDDGVLEDFIQDLIMSVGDSLPVKQLIEECEKRNRLRLLKPILEHLVSEGSQDVHVHSALGKVIIDTNDNPEHFLTKNPYYDSDVLGKYCERRDPTLAVVAYRRAKLDDQLIDVTNKNNLFKLQARYVVERADPQIWKTVLALENPFRRKLIYQVVCSALPESNDSYQISATVKAFINLDRPHELIELLEKFVLQNSTLSGNPNLQYLLIRTAIEADRSRLMTYINRFDNFNGSEIGMIAVRKRLYEEAFHIFKKFNLNVQAVDVLLNHIRSIERAVEFASCVKEDAVWSHLAKAQLR